MTDDGYKSLRAAREIAELPNAIIILRVFQAHGFTLVTQGPNGEVCSIDRVIEEINSERARKVSK